MYKHKNSGGMKWEQWKVGLLVSMKKMMNVSTKVYGATRLSPQGISSPTGSTLEGAKRLRRTAEPDIQIDGHNSYNTKYVHTLR